MSDTPASDLTRAKCEPAPYFTCASCNQFADCQSAFGAPGEVGIGCADWAPTTPTGDNA